MPIQINTDDFIDDNNFKGRYAIEHNMMKKWFFHLSHASTFSCTASYIEACKQVKKTYRDSEKADFGVIVLAKMEDPE